MGRHTKYDSDEERYVLGRKPSVPVCLGGTFINFRSGWLHDALYIDGQLHGGRGGLLRRATAVPSHGEISEVTIGLYPILGQQYWGGGLVCNFAHLKFGDEEVDVTSKFSSLVIRGVPLTYEYSREKLGLTLRLTGVGLSIADTSHRMEAAGESVSIPVPTAYQWTLSPIPGVAMNEAELTASGTGS
eukprot:scaffold1682_cov159-Pinguiococcus_pyrenoidosus.AAC.2